VDEITVTFCWWINGTFRGYRTVSKGFYERLVELNKTGKYDFELQFIKENK